MKIFRLIYNISDEYPNLFRILTNDNQNNLKIFREDTLKTSRFWKDDALNLKFLSDNGPEHFLDWNMACNVFLFWNIIRKQKILMS